MTPRTHHAGALLALWLLSMGMTEGADGPARLLRDINATPAPNNGSWPDSFARVGGLMLFRANTRARGLELYGTDGTVAGTGLVKDISPGPSGGLFWSSLSSQQPLVEANGVVLFPASDGVHGDELWRSDGTAAGTYMLKDIYPGAQGGLRLQYPHTLIWVNAVSGGLMYFLADDGVHGFELWRTDGTASGTFLLHDIQPGSRGAFGGDTLTLNGTTLGAEFHFSAANDATGSELWRTDGTIAGTRLEKDILPGTGSGGPFGFTTLGNAFYFGASGRLWKSDGTAAVTLGSVNPATCGGFRESLFTAGGLVYIKSCQQLHRTDGTPAGTTFLRTFNSGSFGFLGEVDGKVLLAVNDEVHGTEPWVSDGTTAGTVLLKDIRPGSSSTFLSSPIVSEGTAWFRASDGGFGAAWWRTDGTPEGTRLVADASGGGAGASMALPWPGGLLLAVNGAGLYRVDAGSDEVVRVAPFLYGSRLTAFGDAAILTYDDGVHGGEPWRTDGTAEGTRLIRDLNDRPLTNGSNPLYLGTAGAPGGTARALYVMSTGTGTGIWATDGSAGRTVPLAAVGILYREPGAVLDGVVYFTGNDVGHGSELWRSDGTVAGTWRVSAIGNVWEGAASGPMLCGGRICFLAYDETHGYELWSSDGTEAGTAMVAESVPGAEGFGIFRSAVVGDTLYFYAFDIEHSIRLWRSDGTAAGTRIVPPFGDGPTGFCCDTLTPLGGDRLLVQYEDGVHGPEPWITDGTEAGTFLLKDITPGRDAGTFFEAVVVGPTAYFATSDGVHGRELWKTDGTEEGTVQVKDIVPGPDSSSPNFLGTIGNAVVFMTGHPGSLPGSPAWDIWRSDGTEAGTVRIREPLQSYPRAAGAFEGGILFTEVDDEHGLELWRTDGTAEGTAFVQDLAPGPDWSDPRDFVAIGSHIVFRVDDPIVNVELFTGRAAILLGQPERAARDLRDELRGLGLPKGIETSLGARVDAATRAIAAGRLVEARIALDNFVRLVQVFAPRHIDDQEAAGLMQFAEDLTALLETEPAAARPAPEPRGFRQRSEP